MPATYCRCVNESCNYLARCYRNGDREAGNELIETYTPLVAGIVRKVLGPARNADLEDAIQIALLQVLVSVKKWREDCPFCCYLATVTCRRTIDFVRRLRSDRHVELKKNEPIDRSCPIISDDQLKVVFAAIEEFPIEYQEVWRLSEEGRKIEEISVHLGLSIRTVFSRLSVVRARLLEVVKDYM